MQAKKWSIFMHKSKKIHKIPLIISFTYLFIGLSWVLCKE